MLSILSLVILSEMSTPVVAEVPEPTPAMPLFFIEAPTTKPDVERIPEDVCIRSDVKAAHLELRLYVDPTEPNLELAIQGIRALVEGLRKSRGKWDSMCAGTLDETVGLLELRRTKTERARATEEIRRACASSGPDCDNASVMQLFLAGDPLSPALLKHIDVPSLREELGTHGALNRSQRSRYALTPTAPLLRGFTLWQLVGALDPRKWDPEDVARILFEAQEEDRQVAAENASEKATGIYRAVGSHGELPASWELTNALVPMGIGNVRELLGRDLVRVTSTVIHPEAAALFLPSHFPEEGALYRDEWATSHPDVPPIPSIRDTAEKKARLAELTNYIAKRWFETDALAPHPDLDAVRAHLERMNAKERSP